MKAGVFMYAYIYGKIIEKEPENLIIEAGNIGYNIHIAPGMVPQFPEAGQMAKIYIQSGR
jgi:Holliday junction resolvasome RuvABC DNA-binding subunit